MSMQRRKEVAKPRERDREVDGNYWEKKTTERVFSWDNDVGKLEEDAFFRYAPASKFEIGQAVSHPKFGKGIVTSVESAKIEILFQDGAKKLTHNPTGEAPGK